MFVSLKYAKELKMREKHILLKPTEGTENKLQFNKQEPQIEEFYKMQNRNRQQFHCYCMTPENSTRLSCRTQPGSASK